MKESWERRFLKIGIFTDTHCISSWKMALFPLTA
nr:MAG TPA: hypothetical protein [Caudoviricetes sp.]